MMFEKRRQQQQAKNAMRAIRTSLNVLLFKHNPMSAMLSDSCGRKGQKSSAATAAKRLMGRNEEVDEGR